MQPVSKARLWEGRLLIGVTILFLLFDATMKLMKWFYRGGNCSAGISGECCFLAWVSATRISF
jgi:hypothetical protein